MAQEIWGRRELDAEKVASISQSKILTESLILELGPIQKWEVLSIVKKLKRRKATGPDEVPLEILKEMNDEEMEDIMTLLNEWWESESIPDEVTRARVVLIFKKAMQRISKTTDRSLFSIHCIRYLQQSSKHDYQSSWTNTCRRPSTFLEKRSTAQVIHIILRIIDLTEPSGVGASMVLLDWETAFDKVSHAALFHAALFLSMERMNVDQKYINLVRALYRAPCFKVEIEGHSSRYHRQDAGIRQGCPLSPYLFLIIMTILFMT